MKLLNWNVRGLGSPRIVKRLRYMLKVQNPQMVFFMETKVRRSKIEKIWYSCGYVNGIEVDPEGTRRGLCLAWKQEVSVTLRQYSKRHIDVVVDENESRGKWRFTGFYGSPYENDRSNAWAELRGLYIEERILWFVCGDFNEIMYGFEKKGGVPKDERRMKLFRKVLSECILMDMGFSGRWFMWERGNLPETNICERLDRGVANEEWLAMFPEVSIQHLTHSFSDHCPLLVNTKRAKQGAKEVAFRFEAWWTMEESFDEEVKNIWKSSPGNLMQKLNELKNCLRRWANRIQDDRKKRKAFLTDRLSDFLAGKRDDHNLAELIDTKIQLNLEIDKDE
ncbi:reverse transcriptase [Gossypium australe]|uniref:Reverse transcriptase n=1 Tax=Gossypium australe TaxID=47621 RepID=A0A5B6X2Z3_9ROSI|nr:reverse transcriptase [Gossypium australe]